MIGNLWFALLAFVLGAGLTYLRMAGKATRRVAKPVPHRLVMGGIIPGVVDPPAGPSPVDAGAQWKIRVGSPTSAQSEAAAPEPQPVVPLEPPTPLELPVPPDVQPLEPPSPMEAEGLESAAESVAPTPRDVAPATPAPAEPDSSAWWAAAFDRGDPGPYQGSRSTGGARPAGSRILDVDDDFAAALGASAAASAASAALFGTYHRYIAEPESARPERGGRTPDTAPTPPAAELAEPPAVADVAAESEEALIKGNRDSMLYHTPDSPWYGRTNDEEWYSTEEEAQAAGYQRWNSRLADDAS